MLAPAFVNIGAARLLADRVQPLAPHQRLQSASVVIRLAVRVQPYPQPFWLTPIAIRIHFVQPTRLRAVCP